MALVYDFSNNKIENVKTIRWFYCATLTECRLSFKVLTF
jgi:hypothetical protein